MDGGSRDEDSGDPPQIRADGSRTGFRRRIAGKSHAIVEGMRRSTGEVCAWIGCDDMYLPGALMRVGRYFADVPICDWLAGSGETVFPDSGRRGTMRSRVDSVSALRSLLALREAIALWSAPSAFWRRRLVG